MEVFFGNLDDAPLKVREALYRIQSGYDEDPSDCSEVGLYSEMNGGSRVYHIGEYDAGNEVFRTDSLSVFYPEDYALSIKSCHSMIDRYTFDGKVTGLDEGLYSYVKDFVERRE